MFKEGGRLPLPDLHTLLVDDAREGVDVGGGEAAQEVAGGGRVGNALGAEGVEVGFVVAEQFEVLQALAAGQEVVGDVEDVVGLEVRQVTLQQVQVAVDGIGQAQLPDQQVEGAEAAGAQTAGLVADLIVDVVVAEQAAALLLPLLLAEPPPDAALAIAQAPAYLVLHQEYLPAWSDCCRCPQTISPHMPRNSSLFSPPGRLGAGRTRLSGTGISRRCSVAAFRRGADSCDIGRTFDGVLYRGLSLMRRSQKPDTDELIQLTRRGDPSARDRLLARHRSRLRRMVRLHLDRRLIARVDPSDVVQDTLAEAARRLEEYLHHPPLPFYPWLRQIALDRLLDLRRRHLRARKRSVAREEPGVLDLPDESVAELAARLIDLGSSPSRQLLREELRERVRAALGRLPEGDREVLVLRHLEQMPAREVAAVLGVGEGAVRMRLVRALGRLRDLLDQDLGELP